jgi:hypothetical protein
MTDTTNSCDTCCGNCGDELGGIHLGASLDNSWSCSGIDEGPSGHCACSPPVMPDLSATSQSMSGSISLYWGCEMPDQLLLSQLPSGMAAPSLDPRWRKAYEARTAADYATYHEPNIGKRLTISNCCKGCWYCASFAEFVSNRRSIGTLGGIELEAIQ